MKKFVVAVVMFFSLAGVASANLPIDISGSNVEIQNADTMKVRNITVPGYPGKYWVVFQWNPATFMFVAINAGAETVTAGLWSWTVSNYSSSFLHTLTAHTETRTFTVSYQTQSGTPFLCQLEDFIQGNNHFELRGNVPSNNDAKTQARISYTTGFSGCASMYTGQTIAGVIDHIPAWFDFSKAFTTRSLMIGFGAESMICEPDGSHHK